MQQSSFPRSTQFLILLASPFGIGIHSQSTQREMLESTREICGGRLDDPAVQKPMPRNPGHLSANPGTQAKVEPLMAQSL